MITSITVQRTISMGHRLPRYEGICSSPHGHNATFEVEILVPDGQFIDFKEVDRHLNDCLMGMDHAMVLHQDDPLAQQLKDLGFRIVTMKEDPTTEAIAKKVAFDMNLYSRYTILRVTVYETGKYSATVRL